MPEKVCCWLSIFRRTIAGATELVTEKVSISKLLDKVGMGKNALTYLLKNALAEGSEEMASDAVNWLADVMISQDKSEWQETLFHYQVMGFSEDEAFLAAMKEQGRKMLKDGAAGAITGTITAGGRLAGSKIGDGIQSYRNYREAVQNGKQYYALNQLTQGGLARSLGNMNVEQSYRSMSPEAILKNSGLSPTEARFLLESNGYSVKDSPQLPSLLRDGEGGQLQRDEVGRKPFELFADTTEDALNSETNSGGKQTDLLVDTPLTEEENQRIIRNRVENGEYSLRHSHQHYLKHVEGTPQYNNYLRTQLEKGASPPSKLTITEAEAEAIIKKYYGTGTSRKSKGKVGNVEFITVDKVVGVYYENGSWHETKRVAIHYGSNASHIVPVKEKYHD